MQPKKNFSRTNFLFNRKYTSYVVLVLEVVLNNDFTSKFNVIKKKENLLENVKSRTVYLIGRRQNNVSKKIRFQ